jgi:hypothetical protein
MSVVSIIAMARDLGLDRHSDLHKHGVGCGESPLDCMTRTRVWQACFVFELMICAPQGMPLVFDSDRHFLTTRQAVTLCRLILKALI